MIPVGQALLDLIVEHPVPFGFSERHSKTVAMRRDKPACAAGEFPALSINYACFGHFRDLRSGLDVPPAD